jgi:hypothetical protein
MVFGIMFILEILISILKVSKMQYLPDAFRRRLEGEGRALRAAVYFEMQRRYGGVPLVDVVLDPFEEVPEQISGKKHGRRTCRLYRQ